MNVVIYIGTKLLIERNCSSDGTSFPICPGKNQIIFAQNRNTKVSFLVADTKTNARINCVTIKRLRRSL
jgi:hypothetical protein